MYQTVVKIHVHCNVVQHRNLGINSHSTYFRETELFLCLARQVLRNHQCGPRFRDHWYTVYTAYNIYYILLVKNFPNDPGVAVRMGFEPTSFRPKSIESTNVPPFSLKMFEIASVSGAPPQTPLGELYDAPPDPLVVRGFLP